MSSVWPQRLGPVLCVVGARPNFMKMAPILRAFAAHRPAIPCLLIHTGQHYDREMNDRLFEDLNLPAPDVNLGVGSGSHTQQTAEVMRRFEPLLVQYQPSCVLVVGDVNSTLACSLVAAKQNIPVVHVEAGLRSRDRRMPEEINRVLTDQLADRLYTTERSADANLHAEGIAAERIRFVGNVMIDSLHDNRSKARSVAEVMQAGGYAADRLAGPAGYALLTLHRPSNVDQADTLAPLLAVLAEIAQQLPVVFAMHPRTRASIDRLGLNRLIQQANIVVLPPQGYLEMLGLLANARLVLTDSGGLQEETTALGVPCLTLRDNTERPITIEQGSNQLVGIQPDAIRQAFAALMAGQGRAGRVPEYWDGRAAERIAADLADWLQATVTDTGS